MGWVQEVIDVNDKDKVRSRYPTASAEQGSSGEWCVLDISREEKKRMEEAHFPERAGRGLFGLGRTEEEAWADAVRKVEGMEGRRL